MNSDSRKIANDIRMSPLDLKLFLPCLMGMILFVSGIVVGRSVPSTVRISLDGESQVNTARAHGRFGTPRWVQTRTLVADAAAVHVSNIK